CDLPLTGSGTLPSTTTTVEANSAGTPIVDESGSRVTTSFEPEICSFVVPSPDMSLPTATTLDSFMVNPFLAIAVCNCFSVTEFPGLSLTDASPFSRLTSTVATPLTDNRDTRTACAQTSQSMPKMVMSIERISALAGTESAAQSSNSDVSFFISLSLRENV